MEYDVTCGGCKTRIKLIVPNTVKKYECGVCGEVNTIRKTNRLND